MSVDKIQSSPNVEQTRSTSILNSALENYAKAYEVGSKNIENRQAMITRDIDKIENINQIRDFLHEKLTTEGATIAKDTEITLKDPMTKKEEKMTIVTAFKKYVDREISDTIEFSHLAGLDRMLADANTRQVKLNELEIQKLKTDMTRFTTTSSLCRSVLQKLEEQMGQAANWR